jgi:hypothetical protein
MKKQLNEIKRMQQLAGVINENQHSVSDETYGEMDNLIYTDYKDDYDNFISSATNIMDTLVKNNFKVEDIFDYLYTRLTAEV